MRKRIKVLLAGSILVVMICMLVGCGNEKDTVVIDESNAASDGESLEIDEKEGGQETADKEEEGNSSKAEEQDEEELSDTEGDDIEKEDRHVDIADLKPSEGLEFESNGDGTCTIVSMGVCTDEDLVIPEKSPNGDIVTLIDEYAFMSLEDVNSVTLINYDYEIDKHAFQYGEFTTLNIIGGSPKFGESSFSACEDLTSISFSDCNIQADKYAFFSGGKDAELIFSNCTGFIDEFAFQYGDFESLTIDNCELEIDKSAFSSCEALTSIIIRNSTITADEYAFFGCGDSAAVEITDCSITLDDKAFQYASLSTLVITGSKVEMGDSAFGSCEDLNTVNIDCKEVALGEYAFFGCEDLLSVSICDNADKDNSIKIDDRAFQYCDQLENAVIGEGTVEIGKYVFSGCPDDMKISAAGQNYTVNSIEDGLK